LISALGLPTARGWFGGATLGNTIYVVGGGVCDTCSSFGGSEVSAVQAFDTVANAWSTKAFLNRARFGITAVSVNGRIYAFGGTNGCCSQPDPFVEEYNPVTNIWSGKSSMPLARWKLTAALGN